MPGKRAKEYADIPSEFNDEISRGFLFLLNIFKLLRQLLTFFLYYDSMSLLLKGNATVFCIMRKKSPYGQAGQMPKR